MSNVKKGELVRYIGRNPNNRPNVYGWIGVTVERVRNRRGTEGWKVTPPLPGGTYQDKDGYYSGDLILDESLRPIRDQPGNEHWITEARNKLKGKTEITERGELAA